MEEEFASRYDTLGGKTRLFVVLHVNGWTLRGVQPMDRRNWQEHCGRALLQLNRRRGQGHGDGVRSKRGGDGDRDDADDETDLRHQKLIT